MIREVLIGVLWAGTAIGLVSSSYLAGLTACAAVARTRRSPVAGQEPAGRFAVLVPAHNEEELLGRTLTSLRDLDYPARLVEVYVIADNCEDGTEAVVREAGVRVLSRRDPELQGKGYAIRWALQALPLDEYDAVAMVDGDTIVDRGFLRAVDVRLGGGAQAVQGYYGVLAGGTTAESLRAAAFALMHYVRPLGKALFGGSCGLKGNGMAFSAALLRRTGWQSFSVVEDAEQHLRLMADGVVVEFEPEAKVWGEMPSSLRGARSQNLRWEAGRWRMARDHSLRLLALGLRRRSLALLDAGLEPLVPPLSVVAVLGLVALAGGALTANLPLVLAGGGTLAGLALHVVGGLVLARAPRAVWKALLAAPLYVLWKVSLYGQALLGVGGRRWVRTPRASSER